MNKFVCILANSVKFGGRCIAGKEVTRDQKPNTWNLSNVWLRPLGSADRGELLPREYLCGKRDPGLLDIVEIPFDKPKVVPGQPEDWGIVPHQHWAHHGTFEASAAQKMLDDPKDLWLEFPGASDRVSTNYLTRSACPSLQLVAVSDLRIFLQSVNDFQTGQPKLKRRCHFSYRGTRYDLALTDPAMQKRFFPHFPNCAPGQINPGPKSNSILCVSLSPALNGMHYKLVAAVFDL